MRVDRQLLQQLHLLLQFHQSLPLVQVTIHFQPAAQFHVHHVQATIHFQPVAQFHVHHKDRKVLQQDNLVLEWLVLAPDLYVQVLQLDLAHRYHNAIKELARRGLLRVSTDSAPHLVRRERIGEAHEVKTWPILAASLTVSPAEPRLLPAELKADLADLGITIDDDSPEATGSEPARPDGAKAGDEAARRLTLELDLLSLETQP